MEKWRKFHSLRRHLSIRVRPMVSTTGTVQAVQQLQEINSLVSYLLQLRAWLNDMLYKFIKD